MSIEGEMREYDRHNLIRIILQQEFCLSMEIIESNRILQNNIWEYVKTHNMSINKCVSNIIKSLLKENLELIKHIESSKTVQFDNINLIEIIKNND